MMLLISLAILSLIALLKMTFALLIALSSFKTGGAVFTTTHRSKIEKILNSIHIHEGQVVYDLGSGDGRFLIAIAKRCKVKAIGYEINPWPYLLSKIRIWLSRENIPIRFKDFYKADLRDGDIIFCYLFPDVMEKLREKLSEELKVGAKVISCNFEIPGWKASNIITASHPRHKDPIYIYNFTRNDCCDKVCN